RHARQARGVSPSRHAWPRRCRGPRGRRGAGTAIGVRTVPPSPGWWRRVVLVAVLAAVISPALRDRDSFPLSTYPMYAGTRGRVVSIATAVGVDATGRAHYLSLSSIADTDDPLIAESAVRHAINTGRAGALCVQIAERLGGRSTTSKPTIERVEVVDE